MGITSHAQKVSNVTFRQEQSTIIVSYDLETKTPCEISLFVSTDDGNTWQGPLKKVTGDAGNKIATGNHSIIWNVLEEFEELRGDKIKFQVKADVGNIETIVIGTQEWTVKNLDVSTYRNGDIIPELKDPKEWVNLKTGAWCYYNNDPKNGEIYGKLYNWYAVNDPRGLAPKGFHIPSDNEWSALITFLGGEDVAGGKMKSTGTSLWSSPNTNATNDSGFSGLPAGYRGFNGEFYNFSSYGYWWSSSICGTINAWGRGLFCNNGSAGRYNNYKNDSFTVRCLRDQVRAQEDDNEDTSIYKEADIEVKPDFPGGLEKFYKFISKNFQIPEEDGLKGKVFVTFVIETDGSLSDIKVLRDIGYDTGKEAIRVLKTCPRWIPGEVNGKKVRVLYSLPISIGSRE